MSALDDRADHDTWTTVLPPNLGHRRIPDREVRRTTKNSCKGLRVSAGGAHFHVEAVLLEDARVHADVEIDVAEIMDGFAEAHFLEGRSGSAIRADDGRHRQATRNGCGCRQKIAAAEGEAVCGEKLMEPIDHGSKLLGQLIFSEK